MRQLRLALSMVDHCVDDWFPRRSTLPIALNASHVWATYPLTSQGLAPWNFHSYCLLYHFLPFTSTRLILSTFILTMVSKSFIAYAFLLCFTTSVNAHAAIAPALGVKGNPIRSDVQNPSSGSPCGNINIAQTLDTSTPAPASANGSFSASITDFNAGSDGSRSIKAVQVDPSGTGKNFVAAKMIVNGDANPTSAGTEQLSVQLPAGTKCTGGTAKNLCLASFTTTAGFGNCVVVSQGANNQTASPDPASTKPDKNTTNSNKSDKDTGAAKGGKRSSPVDADDQTETTTGDKSHHGGRAAGAGAVGVIRRRASSKRGWASRE